MRQRAGPRGPACLLVEEVMDLREHGHARTETKKVPGYASLAWEVHAVPP